MSGSGIRRSVYPLYGATGHERTDRAHRPDHAGAPLTYGSFAEGIECWLPSPEDWHYLQPSEATDPSDVWDPDAHRPWPCIVVTDRFSPRSGPVSSWDGDWSSAANSAAADAVHALRLLKSGWFLDPALSECIHDDGRGHLRRRMGAYRLTYHDEDVARPRPIEGAYRIEDGDFGPAGHAPGLLDRWLRATHRPKPTRLETIFVALRRHRVDPVSSAEITLEAFGRSHGSNLDLAQRLTLLTIAFEAVLGSWGHGDRSASRRLGTALAMMGSPDSGDSVRWVESEVRPLRNAVAHGMPIDGAGHVATVRRFIKTMRILTLQYLHFSLHWRAGGAPIDAVAGPGASCTTVFNRCLTRVADEGATDADKLWLRGP